MKEKIFITIAAVALVACSPDVPDTSELQEEHIAIFPDNDGATLPPNIAPMCFRIIASGDYYVTRFYNGSGDEMVVGGREVQPSIDGWHSLLAATRGDTLFTDVYIHCDGHWLSFPTLKNFIAIDSIDRYLSYRLIAPSFICYEDITINQRDLSNFSTCVVYDNGSMSKGDEGQCVNCHNYQNWNRTGRMQMHLRENNGGTLIVNGEKAVKVSLKTDSTRSAGVYPAWHPTANLIAYSVNSTGQVFHTRDAQKVEVIDFGSDIVLFDPSANTVYGVSDADDEMESFPAWSPDGKTLYYCSAHFEQQTDNIDAELDSHYQDLHYNIYCRSFDVQTRHFGSQRLVLDAAGGQCSSAVDPSSAMKAKSATLPRLSPDGRYLLFALGDYGNFHIWHRSSDLWLMDLKTEKSFPLTAVNSPETESYHSWSSNGRWIVFSSRRLDGNYTRPYIAYFDRHGCAHKPFLLPQASSCYYDQLFKSFNIPELMAAPIKVSRKTLLDAASKEAAQTKYGGRLSPKEENITITQKQE